MICKYTTGLILAFTIAATGFSSEDAHGKVDVIVKTTDNTRCMPRKLKDLLRQISRRFGKPVLIVSGKRPPKDNAKRGGKKNSAHLRCNAADFTIPGVNNRTAARYLYNMKGRGGAGLYCHGRLHIDVEGRRQWGGCLRKYISLQTPLLNDEHVVVDPNYGGEILFKEDGEVVELEHDHEIENDVEVYDFPQDRDFDTYDVDEAYYYDNLVEV